MTFPDFVLLQHIIEQCKRVSHVVDRTTYEGVLKDTAYQDALAYPLQNIGEAAGNLSEDFKIAHPEIPIATIKGMRNVFAHQYYSIDIANVWYVATVELPVLEKQIRDILKTDYNYVGE